MQAKDIFLLVSGKLADLEPGLEKRWPWEKVDSRISLVDIFNSGLRQIALNRPDSTAVTEKVKLQPGVRQLIPDPTIHQSTKKALSLIEVIQNLGSDGVTPGDPIFIAARDAMSAYDWSTPGTVIDNYAYDFKLNPMVYWVYPAVHPTTQVWVEVTYSAEPTPITLSTDTFTIPDTFAGPMMHWMLYEIFSGDNSSSNMGRAQHHMTAFYQALGVKLKSDLFFPVQIAQQGA